MAINYEQIGRIIRQRRDELNMTGEELAGKVGVTEPTISRYENGENRKLEMYDKIAEALEIKLSSLFELDSPAPQRNEIKEAASQEDRRIRNLISKFREQASLSTKRHLATHIDFLLKVKVEE